MLIRKVMLAIYLIFSCSLSNADDDFDWIGGVVAAACALLPLGTCESMKRENHENMSTAIVTSMLQRLCESKNYTTIEEGIKDRTVHPKCKELFEKLKKAGLLPIK